MKAFFVDDSPVILERLASLLSGIEGVEVIGQAQNVRDAIEAIIKLKPDVVILDIRLKGGNGISVLQELKQKIPSLVIIMLTNYPYPEYRRKCEELGADYFFDKVTDIEKIAEVFKELMKGK